MWNYLNYAVNSLNRDRRDELMREAERERLVRVVLAGRRNRANVRRLALVWAGRRLMSAGSYLLQLAAGMRYEQRNIRVERAPR